MRESPAVGGAPSLRPQAAPAAFVGHGGPTKVLETEQNADMLVWGQSLRPLQAALVFSAHWQAAGCQIGTTTNRELIYDFGGFPAEMYRQQYKAPVAADLAAEVTSRLLTVPQALATGGVGQHSDRGWDHGVWTATKVMWPQADVPLLQLALPKWPFSDLFQLGRALTPMRQNGVLVLGSGSATHNLGLVNPGKAGEPPPAWAVEFDHWLAEVFVSRDWDSLIAAAVKAPAYKMNHPTDEHFAPLVLTAGAGADDRPTFPVVGWEYSIISRRCVQMG